jgi:C4-dicarboxylate-specific signal transduction histidine kinase
VAAIDRCRETGEAVVEYRFTNAGGEQRWLRDQMMLGNPEDTGCEIVVYVTDITEEYLGRLRLQQSERLATLGLLTTNIAHEMNQPLAAIRMAAENGLRILQRDMAQRGFDETEAGAGLGSTADGFMVERSVQGKLQRIISQTHRISDVISHVRAFGRSDGSQPEDVEIGDIVDEALMLAEARIVETGVVPRVNLQPGLPILHTVRVPLEQVVMNIIINACDAYDGRGNGDEASAHRPLLITSRAEGDTILLSIADRAGGIPPQLLSRIFDPFFTTKPVGLGTGVGLFVSMISINELGGTLTAHNETGGAVFEIRLPLIAAVRVHERAATGRG